MIRAAVAALALTLAGCGIKGEPLPVEGAYGVAPRSIVILEQQL